MNPAPVSAELEQGRAALITATRTLNNAAALSELDVAGLSAATRAITAVTEQLGAQSRERLYRSSQFNADVCRPGTTVSVSTYNPVAVPLEVKLGGDGSAATTLIGNALHEGPPSSVLHGGTSAWLMDTVLGLSVQSLGVRAMTGQLEVRYLHRTPLSSVAGRRPWSPMSPTSRPSMRWPSRFSPSTAASTWW